MSARPDNVVAFPAAHTGVVLIPEGLYPVAFEGYTLATKFGRGVLELKFKITDFGEYFERPLSRFYKVTLDGKRTFRASPHSAFVREFMAVFRKAPPAGVAAVNWYRDLSVEASVRTVMKDHKQRPLPELARYSTIDALVRRFKP